MLCGLIGNGYTGQYDFDQNTIIFNQNLPKMCKVRVMFTNCVEFCLTYMKPVFLFSFYRINFNLFNPFILSLARREALGLDE